MNIGHSSNTKGTFFLGVAHTTVQNKPAQYFVKINNKREDVRLIGRQNAGSVDLALFFLPGKETMPCFQVAAEDPPIGKECELVGFPWNLKTFRVLKGQIIPPPHGAYHYGFSRRSVSGDSGGPIMSIPEQEVIGIMISYAVEDSTGLLKSNVNSIKDIRQFLTAQIGGVPTCRVTSGPAVIKSPTAKPIVTVVKSPNENLERKIKFLELQIKLGRTKFKNLHLKIFELEERISKLDVALKTITLKAGPEGPEGKEGPIGPEGKAGKVNVKIHDERTHERKEHKNVKSGSTLEVNISTKETE